MTLCSVLWKQSNSMQISGLCIITTNLKYTVSEGTEDSAWCSQDRNSITIVTGDCRMFAWVKLAYFVLVSTTPFTVANYTIQGLWSQLFSSFFNHSPSLVHRKKESVVMLYSVDDKWKVDWINAVENGFTPRDDQHKLESHWKGYILISCPGRGEMGVGLNHLTATTCYTEQKACGQQVL